MRIVFLVVVVVVVTICLVCSTSNLLSKYIVKLFFYFISFGTTQEEAKKKSTEKEKLSMENLSFKINRQKVLFSLILNNTEEKLQKEIRTINAFSFLVFVVGKSNKMQ